MNSSLNNNTTVIMPSNTLISNTIVCVCTYMTIDCEGDWKENDYYFNVDASSYEEATEKADEHGFLRFKTHCVGTEVLGFAD